MPRLFAAALAVFVAASPVHAQDRVDLIDADPITKMAYAVGFRAATHARDDSASFAFFDYDTFSEGFSAGLQQDSSRLAYLLGYDLGQKIAADDDLTLSPEVFMSGFREGLAFDAMQFEEAEMREILSAVQDSVYIRDLRARATSDEAARQSLAELRSEMARGDSLLGVAATREGAVIAESGLVYVSTSEGTGAEVGAEDVVRVNYTGKLVDGTVFDESQDGSAEFSLQQVVSGFAEGITGMREGGTRTLYLPARLAFGLQGSGPTVPAGAALVFDVELLEVVTPDPASDEG